MLMQVDSVVSLCIHDLSLKILLMLDKELRGDPQGYYPEKCETRGK
jgi:hypothetical protein